MKSGKSASRRRIAISSGRASSRASSAENAGRSAPSSRGAPQDRRAARVPVLNVVDGIVQRLLLRQIQVELQRRVVPAHQVEEPGRVAADLADHLVEGDELTLALAHRDRLSVAQQADDLDEDDPQHRRVVAERLQRRLHARDVAVVVGAPDVAELGVSARQLLAVIGDVGQQVGRKPVGLHDDAVLVVAPQRRRPQPDGAVVAVDESSRLERLPASTRRRLTCAAPARSARRRR